MFRWFLSNLMPDKQRGSLFDFLTSQNFGSLLIFYRKFFQRNLFQHILQLRFSKSQLDFFCLTIFDVKFCAGSKLVPVRQTVCCDHTVCPRFHFQFCLSLISFPKLQGLPEITCLWFFRNRPVLHIDPSRIVPGFQMDLCCFFTYFFCFFRVFHIQKCVFPIILHFSIQWI